jgi:hypothetical protein
MQRRVCMTENEEIQTLKNTSFTESKFGKVIMTIVAVLLIFAGPTYVIYGLSVIAKVDLAASAIVGLVLFIIGLFMMRYLVQKKIIS